MKVNEIFESIQGEGSYAGYPVLFIRLSGCNLNCDFCDTKYNKEGDEISVDEIVDIIRQSHSEIIVWTGGEPLLQKEEMYKIINKTKNYDHHIETNGILLTKKDFKNFDYICCSPKKLEVAKKVSDMFLSYNKDEKYIDYDIKVVTDLKLNIVLIPYATMLMPLTMNYKSKDEEIKQNVWNYCSNNKIRYCLRQHVEVWGSKKGV